jgi:hypothetical protein
MNIKKVLYKYLVYDIIKIWKNIHFLEDFMLYDMENIVENIDFSMTMEDMPLTNEDKNRLRDCLNGIIDVDEILQEVIKKHTFVEI